MKYWEFTGILELPNTSKFMVKLSGFMSQRLLIIILIIDREPQAVQAKWIHAPGTAEILRTDREPQAVQAKWIHGLRDHQEKKPLEVSFSLSSHSKKKNPSHMSEWHTYPWSSGVFLFKVGLLKTHILKFNIQQFHLKLQISVWFMTMI